MPDPWRAAWLVTLVCVLASLPRAREPLAACGQPVQLQSGPVEVVACEHPGAAPLEGPARRLFDLPIDVNRASAETLESLPGIGPGRAEAIVAGRPYADLAELRRVPGIGPILLARIRPFLALGPSPAPEGLIPPEPIASGATIRR